MKPFDLKLAKQGHPVCTREGRPVRIVCFDRKATDDKEILALIDRGDCEAIGCYHRNGYLLSYNIQDDDDLMMASVKHEGWINIKRIGDDPIPYVEGMFESESKAEDVARIGSSCENHITTLKIEWEE